VGNIFYPNHPINLKIPVQTKAHGGEIKVETKEGKGSVFIITLPFV
jgi:signal transduction histidine kinase